MKKLLLFLLLAFPLNIGLAQTLEVRPQFGHDPLWGDVSDDGRYAVTASRNTVILWDMHNGDVILERPYQCLGVHFIEGYPFYCVAMNRIHEDLSIDSIDGVYSVVNLLTNEILFVISEKGLPSYSRVPFKTSFPFDPRGRMEVINDKGERDLVLGGKLPGGISNVDVSPDGKYLLVGGKHPVIWDLEEMRVFREIPLYEKYMKEAEDELIDAGLDIIPFRETDIKYKEKAKLMFAWRQFFKAHFTENGTVISGTPRGDIYVYSLDGDILNKYCTPSSVHLIYDCVQVDSSVLAATSNNWVYAEKTRIDSLQNIRPPEGTKTYRVIYEVLPLPDKGLFLASTDGPYLYAGNLSRICDELEVVQIPSSEGYTSSLSLARVDDDTVIITGLGGRYDFLHLSSRIVETFGWEGVSADLHACIVLSDGRILLGANLGKIGMIHSGQKEVATNVSYGFGQIRGFAEDIERSHIYVSSSDGALRILDSRTLSLIATCYYLGDGNSIVFTPDGYYSADKNVANLIMYGRGLELYSFDRFDLIKNRPDIIKERLGGSKDEVTLLRSIYARRLRRMGFTEKQLQEETRLPETTITRFPSAGKINVDKITVGVQFKDKTCPIVKVMAWLNGTPLFGRSGLSVKGNELEHLIEVQLATGKNRLEVSCVNAAGVESLRETRTITYINPDFRRELYVVTIGVSEYRDVSYNLRYAAKDATDISRIFTDGGRSIYNEIHTLNITNQDVGTDTPNRIREFLSEAGRDDAVIIFYAGHGLLSRNYDYYLSTYATDFASPETSAINYETFESVFDEIPSLDKLVLIDACHSGEIYKEDILAVASTSTTKRKVLFRGASLGKESLESQLLRAQFNDLRRGTGTTILAGSSGLEVAVEGEQWENGLFTWTIREGLQKMAADFNRDGVITVSELMRYGETEVHKLSEGRQSPEARSINQLCDFILKESGQDNMR